MRNDWAVRLGSLLLVVVVLVGCSREPERYDFGVAVAGGPKGWPVWVEDVHFDDRWGVPVGAIDSGYENTPPTGPVARMSPKPPPQTIFARWFSYRTQTFYEIHLALPDDMAQQVARWYRQYPRPDYLHKFVVGLSGTGEAKVLWRASCLSCEWGDFSQDFLTTLIEGARGQEVEGDPYPYVYQTTDYVDEGVIPLPDGFQREEMPPIKSWFSEEQ
ncbi:hypothetical protein GCM10009104_26420 [Marinobacterium maritimum]|uniref:DUF2931 family protein n=1 Tax=Marinobacterium maritimum TaxID=500162 RepID=A0ABP3TF37_9GAMM